MDDRRRPENDRAPTTRPASKEPYRPPRVRFIEISVDEALMGICKGGLGAGPLGPGCPGGCRGGGS